MLAIAAQTCQRAGITVLFGGGQHRFIAIAEPEFRLQLGRLAQRAAVLAISSTIQPARSRPLGGIEQCSFDLRCNLKIIRRGCTAQRASA